MLGLPGIHAAFSGDRVIVSGVSEPEKSLLRVLAARIHEVIQKRCRVIENENPSQLTLEIGH